MVICLFYHSIMKKLANLEFWLRGPVPGIAPLLQPAAHALLQAREDVNVLMEGFPEEKLWDRPGGVASPGFHLQHLTGVLDRMLTYARGEALSPAQFDYLKAEGKPAAAISELVHRFNQQINRALEEIGRTPEVLLTEVRPVGRGLLPSTVGGLLFHAAEHTQRHVGQLLVTVRVLHPAQMQNEGG
jgi:uncharacterized damage-inducible protein DinB